MLEVTKKWVNEHGEGHWEVSDGVSTIACDDSELSDVIKNFKEENK